MKPFRNLTRHQIAFTDSGGETPSLEQMSDYAKKYQFRDLSGYERISMGIVRPDDSKLFFESLASGMLFTIKTAQRRPPESFVNEVFTKRLTELDRKGKKVLSKEEAHNLKAEIEMELTPRALPVIRHNQCFINLSEGVFWLDTVNDASVDFIIQMFEQMLPGAEITPYTPGPILETRMKKLMTSAKAWPYGISREGDGAIANEQGRTHIKPMSTFLREDPSKIFQVRYMGINARGVRLRWHPDGTYSSIEGNFTLKYQIDQIFTINEAIDQWLQKSA